MGTEYACTCDSSCYNETCGCDNSCDSDECDQCDASCHGHSACSCDSSCDSDLCDQCDASCYGYSACSCNNTCYGYGACDCNSTCNAQTKGSCTCNNTCYSGYSACSCNSACHGYSTCTCNSTCNSDSCDTCDASCNGYSACSCDSSCDGDLCDTCDASCNAESCDTCDNVEYGTLTVTEGIDVEEGIAKETTKVLADVVSITDTDVITCAAPSSWDLLDEDWSDENGPAQFLAAGTNSHSNDGNIETITAGDTNADSDYCLAQYTNLGFGANRYITVDFKFKPTNLANYSSNNRMIEVTFYSGSTTSSYTWFGIYLDQVMYRYAAGDIRKLGDISPTLSNGGWYYCRAVFDTTDDTVTTWFSSDGITYTECGSATYTGGASSEKFEIGIFESNGGGSLSVDLDYTKVVAGNYGCSGTGAGIVKTFTKTLTNTAHIGDSIIKTITKPFSNTATISDSIVKTITKAFSDEISVSESITKTVTKTLSDIVQVGESIVKTITKYFTDIAQVGDSIAKTFTRVFTDGVKIVDWTANRVIATYSYLAEGWSSGSWTLKTKIIDLYNWAIFQAKSISTGTWTKRSQSENDPWS